ncbi:Uncharacterised protein [uncultured archaeon]|nr:Uncharacterised protein [uncultured archaeon]
MSNEKKSATLGMPHGTASNRLRKIVLFHLLKKLNENTCFKCQGIIEAVEDLSIEHKKPWEGISAELFWDIENIAFSHLNCNRPDRQFRKYTPEQAVTIRRDRTAQYMRDAYTADKRREKYERTGH